MRVGQFEAPDFDPFLDFSVDPEPRKMVFHRTLAGACCVCFAGTVPCRGSRMHPPMIANFCDMADPCATGCLIMTLRKNKCLHRPQDQIIILGTVVGTPKSLDLLQKRLFQHQKMADIIIRAQEFQIEIFLEMRLGIMGERLIHLVLVGIEEPETFFLRTFVPGPYHFKKRVLRQDIIMIHEGDQIARGIFQTLIGICGDPSVFGKAPVSDDPFSRAEIRMFFLIRTKNFLRSAASAAVRKHQFPLRIGLLTDRLQEVFQKDRLCLIQWNDKADQRSGRKGLLQLPLLHQIRA